MPSRADILAATPKCPLEVSPRDFYRKRTVGKKNAHPCGARLTYHRADAMWCCPVHGPVVAGAELVVKQRTTFVRRVASSPRSILSCN